MQFITEVSIVVLMVGTLVGGITQIGEAGATAILYFNPNITGPIVNGSGRILMVIFVICIVAPLCDLKNMRKVSYVFISHLNFMHNELHSVAGMSEFLGEVVPGTFACFDTSVLTNHAACDVSSWLQIQL